MLNTPARLYPVLPLRDIVVFPGMIVPLFVGRDKSIHAIEAVSRHDGRILLVTQKNASDDDPGTDDIYRVGVLANILQLLKLPDGTVKVLVEGYQRVRILCFVENPTFFQAETEVLADMPGEQSEVEALSRSITKQFEEYLKLNKKIPPEIMGTIAQISDSGRLADTVASHLALKIPDKQRLLETQAIGKRLEFLFSLIEGELSVLNTERRIRTRVKRQMEKTQKEYYLNEQMKAIQKELGEGGEGVDEINEMEKRIKKTRLSKEACEKAKSEVKKLRMMSPMSAESTVVRNYLDWILSIPWKKRTHIKSDITLAEHVLNEDHYGLEKIKERIVEHLAVQQRTRHLKGQILCFVGPPGVGKTSLAQSIARATGRNFVRIALGGVRDEAEIRGHRRTYIGSMPGKIIQSMRKAGSSNPLMLLDEVDKLGQDFRGDPAAALLEVLDSEQNHAFNDHYLEVDYDLSEVMFIATANNTASIPLPLLDRLEVIRLSGYTEDEKVEIALRHLLPKQAKQHGLKTEEWSVSAETLRDMIRYYTRESGVRSLEREVAKIARKCVTRILKEKKETVSITSENLKDYLGVRKHDFGEVDKDDRIGVTTGLAYTQVGGDLLPIEVVLIPGGKGKITLTGKLGDVMQESAQAAWSYVRSRAAEFGIPFDVYQKNDIHVHVPEGATPKDGPSAGAAICTSIVSAMTHNPVRRTVAMTGEISLRGMVMPIGGLKEKLLAALRGGIETVLIPEKNVKDLEEIPENVKKGLTLVPVSIIDEVLRLALTHPLVPIQWEVLEKGLPAAVSTEGSEEVITH